MITFDLAEAGDVVDEVGQCHVCLGSQDANASEYQSTHRTLNEAEHVLDTAADFLKNHQNFKGILQIRHISSMV